jgi:outer membrane immunogenic protein
VNQHAATVSSGVFQHNRWDPATATFNPATYATAALASAGPFVVTGSSGPIALSVHPQGWLAGGQAGYNWQQNALVYGVEADIDWSNIRGSTSAPFSVNGTSEAISPTSPGMSA